jgi:hypothetical protein
MYINATLKIIPKMICRCRINIQSLTAALKSIQKMICRCRINIYALNVGKILQD